MFSFLQIERFKNWLPMSVLIEDKDGVKKPTRHSGHEELFKPVSERIWGKRSGKLY